MILKTKENDLVTLSLVKDHLYITETEHDSLLQTYITASEQIVTDYIHAPAIVETWTNDQHELIETVNGAYMLYLENEPHEVLVKQSGVDIVLPITAFHYFDNYLYVPYDLDHNGVAPSEINAKTGKPKHTQSILQARLLLIASYFSFRNNDLDLRVSELPMGIKMILGNCTDASL